MAEFKFEYQKYKNDKELSAAFQHLLTEARIATDNAYAPYSNFRVGAAVLMSNGEIVLGVNVENASYPVGICAERTALASAISQYPDEKIVAVAISITAPQGDNNTPAFPCGMCRQFISECEDRNEEKITLILAGQIGEVYIIDSPKDLLPFSFSGKDLKP